MFKETRKKHNFFFDFLIVKQYIIYGTLNHRYQNSYGILYFKLRFTYNIVNVVLKNTFFETCKQFSLNSW